MGNTKELTVVQWHNSYSVGIKLVDEQHMKLIDLTNKLFQNCLESREQYTKVFLDTIHDAVDYIGYHFSTEELIMKRINYPDLVAHKKEHTEFVREFLSRANEFNSDNKMNTPLAFVYFLKDWVLRHIAVCDKKMGDYIITMHKSGELKKLFPNSKKV